MIGFIGLGAAGGNVADEASNQGFYAVAMNYSQKDLDSLEFIKNKVKLVGSEGVGKNREEAIRLMDRNWESAVAFVKDNFSTPTLDVIFVCFSTGGGSGSGIAPILLEILMNEMPDKTFVAVPILPDLTEVMSNQMNCIQTSEELSRLDIGIFPIDNEQVRKKYNTHGKGTIYKVANSTFITLLKEIVSYTKKESKNGVLDEKDLYTLFATKGIGLMSQVNLSQLKKEGNDLTKEGISNAVRHSWENGVFVPYSDEKIIRAGLILDAQESLMPLIHLPTLFGGFKSGMPIDLFEGYYHIQTGTLYTILTGLSWYQTRLKKIEKMIKEKQENAEQVFSQSAVYQSEVSSFSFRKITDVKENKRSVSDILKKYKR